MKRRRQAAAAIALLAGLWGLQAGQPGERQAQTAPALEETDPSRWPRWDREPFKARPAMDMPPKRPRPDPIGPLILTEQVRPARRRAGDLPPAKDRPGIDRPPEVETLTFEIETDGQDRELVGQVIERLKDRIDPKGLYALEWRPIGKRRFEVRMPLGTDAARRAKQEYLRAFQELQDDNIQRSQMRRVATLTGAARAAEIERIAGGDAARKEALAKVARTSEAMATARAAWEKAKADPNATLQAVNEAEKVYLDALDVYTRAVENALAGNLDTEKFGDTLRLYVSAREAGAIGMAERDERQKAFDQRLEQLRGRYPARRAKIDRVVSAYTDWAEKRIGLDDPADLKRLVAKVGVLEFRIAATLPNSAREPKLTEPLYLYYQNQLTEQGPMFGRSRNEPYQWFELRAKSEKLSTDTVIGKYANKRYMLLCNESELVMLHETGRRSWKLQATAGLDREARPTVQFTLDDRGAKLMGTLTGGNIGKLMAVLLDDQVYSAPNIKEAIYGNGIIEGDFTQQQVGEIVQLLNAGALPARIRPIPGRHAAGSGRVRRTSIRFKLRTSGRAPSLDVELNPADKGLTHISFKLAEGVSPELRDQFLDFIGGAMFLIEDVQPPLTEAELADRIAAMRWQPDFAERRYNDTAVVGLTPSGEGEGFVSLAVLVRNPYVDHAGQAEAWRRFAADELNLLTEALGREEWLEPVKPGRPVATDAGKSSSPAEHWYLLLLPVVLGGGILVYLWVRRGRRRVAEQPQEGE